MNTKKKWGVRLALSVILLLQVLFLLRYCNYKSGYFVDELWSYGLSNSYYHAQIYEDGAMDETKVDPQMMWDYLVVNEGEEFTYGSVLYNQTHDCHPPLFYMVLHTISSFFPGEFSMWFGLIPNLVYFVITSIFIFKIAGLFFEKSYYALFPVIMYGFSLAAVNSVTYIRMYMMLTMWCMMFAWFHLQTFIKKEISWKSLAFLFVTTAGGVFTQYFFLIFAAPWVILYMLWLLAQKNWKNMAKYVVTGCLGVAAVIVVYPTSVLAVLGMQPGHSENMYRNIGSMDDWMERLTRYNEMVNGELFGGLFAVIIGAAVFVLLAYMAFRVIWRVETVKGDTGLQVRVTWREKTGEWLWKVEPKHLAVAAIAMTVIFYYLIVVKIAPLYFARYFMCIYPEIFLLFCLLAYGLAKLWKYSGRVVALIMLLCVLAVNGYTIGVENPECLYEEKKDNPRYAELYSDVPTVYFYRSYNEYLLINNALELIHFDNLYQMCYDNFEQEIENVEVGDSGLIVYLDRMAGTEMDYQQCKAAVKKRYGLTQESLVFEDDKVFVYYLYNEPDEPRTLADAEDN